MRRLEGIRQIDPRALFTTKQVPCLVELQPNLHMGDRIRCHHQLVAVQARKQVLSYVVVPEIKYLRCAVSLPLPSTHQRAVDDVDRLDEEGASACGRVEDRHELVGRLYAVGQGQARWRSVMSPQ